MAKVAFAEQVLVAAECAGRHRSYDTTGSDFVTTGFGRTPVRAAMRPELAAVLLGTVVAASASVEVLRPFEPTVHAWWFALGVTLVGVYLLVAGGAWTLRAGASRAAALAAFGGALLAAGVADAAFLGGQPERIGAAPGQTYRPPHAANIAVEFPTIAQGGAATWPNAISIIDGKRRIAAVAGDVVRAGPFVFAVDSAPIAYVDVRSTAGKVVTMTQPDGPAFLSRFLMFAGMDGDRPEDYFEVPALHRNVQVDYWPGLPARGINIPFLALRISEENGGALYEGVAISGRAVRAGGLTLAFALGTYPEVTASSAPPIVPYAAGLSMFGVGWIGFAAQSFKRHRAA